MGWKISIEDEHGKDIDLGTVDALKFKTVDDGKLIFDEKAMMDELVCTDTIDISFKMGDLSYQDLIDGMKRMNNDHFAVWTDFGIADKLLRKFNRRRYFSRKGVKRRKK